MFFDPKKAQIFTSNFANNGIHHLGGISITRYPSRAQQYGFKGLEFPPLIPPAELLRDYKDKSISWEEYKAWYQLQLQCLDPLKTVDRLIQLSNPVESAGAIKPVVMLCYESAKNLATKPCHRRLVADWLEAKLSIDVPEWVKES